MTAPIAPVAVRSRTPARPVRVALVSMPWASASRPSIQIALLAAIANRRGHRADTLHLNLEFVKALEDVSGDGARLVYEQLAEERFAAGDWFFSGAAFGPDAPDPDAMIERWRREGTMDDASEPGLRRVYEEVAPQWITSLVDSIDWASYDLAGFTSTFQQNAASFALARRLAEHHPHLAIVFGGANFDDEMGVEWMRSMPFIDYAIRGEADASFPALLDAIAAGTDPGEVPGVLLRREGEVVGTDPVPFRDLDANPVPDYTEYFDRLRRLGFMHRLQVSVPYESARGCWWGERRHCTFCGLNGQTMAFRSKAPARVLEELSTLALRHRVLHFAAVDNIIDTDYLRRMLPGLATKGRPFRLFYETKADLGRGEIELLARSGVDSIQPGIESLSSRVLALMRKGTRAIWNVNLLRWAAYYNVDVSWNLLYGFPGETGADLEEQARTCRLLVHLQPPGAAGRVWMERFSPLFTERDLFPVARLRPHGHYREVFPAHVDFGRAAYFFDYELEDTVDDEAFEPVTAEVERWTMLDLSETPPSLVVEDDDDLVVVCDGRDAAAPTTHVLEGIDAAVHRTCMETWRRRRDLSGLAPNESEVDDALDRLVEAGLLFRDGGLHVALATPAEPAPVRGRWRQRPASRTTAGAGTEPAGPQPS